MCLAIPGKIILIKDKVADVDFGGIGRKVGLDLLPDVKIGDYIIVHAGFAIQILDAGDAKERLDIFKKILCL
ncbi:MAG: HypC/HybG/HupF family hydrogenase formation chaperone [Elusimicrobiota bacterium]|nr:HypC/HybG/HupF family hydrogenase formation chaperone [Elusimicrobiota bacterium]